MVEENMGLVRAVVSGFCKGERPEDSELFPLACMAFMKAAATFDPSRAKFSTWATRIMRNRILSELRKMKRRPVVSLHSLERKERERSLVDTRSGDFPVLLYGALTKRDSSDSEKEQQNKKILLRHYLDGTTWAEIGREFGLSKEAVRQRAQKAISSIRRKNASLLEDYS